MSCKTANRLNLTQCLTIKANQYRSSDNRRDYQADEIDERIHELQARKDERTLNTSLKLMNAIAIEAALGADEGQAAQWDYRHHESEEIRIYKPNGFSYDLILVPGIICNF